ncbi:MAG TPA: dTMP kinase [Candidatus Eisenbacteria bacterium]
MNPHGLFVTFEGIEGSGKSTQLRRAATWLAERGHRVVTTREPGGTRMGEAIRAMLLDPSSELGGEAELFLYLADRAETMRQVIEPGLALGAVVLGDRHTDATLAYQGAMRGIGLERARDLNALATRGRRPHLTLLFDLDAAIGLGRAGGRRGSGSPDRLEAEAPPFHDGVRRAYLALAAAEPERMRVVNAAAAPDVVWEEVRRHLESIVPPRFPS